jgi:hypothetical protein
MYGFWGTVLLAGMLNNAFNALWHHRVSHSSRDAEQAGGSNHRAVGPVFGAWHWIKTHVIIPSSFGTYHRRLLYGFSVPTRIEAFIIWAYWAISLILCAVNIRTFEGNL